MCSRHVHRPAAASRLLPAALLAGWLLLAAGRLSTKPPAGSSVGDDVQIVDQILKARRDTREYRGLTFANGLRVLLVSDPTADRAAAAMNVAAGSSRDPRSAQGLAHLVEHMLFMGTAQASIQTGSPRVTLQFTADL